VSRPLRASILAAAVVVLLATAFAAGCSYVDPPALSMSATTSDAPYYTLTREQMFTEMNADASTSTTAASIPTKDTASFLNKRVNEEFLKHFMAEKNIEVTAADTARAQQAASASSSSSQPDPEQLKTQAQLIAIYRTLADDAFKSGTVDKEQKLREFYDANKSRIETPAQVCLHVIALQAGTGTTAPTEADFAAALTKANAVRARLDTEKFETVADAETPAQSSQGSQGGDAGCIDAANLGDVQAAVEALPDGVISQPLRTERGGFYIVRVDKRVAASLPTFDSVKDQIEVEVSQQIGQTLLPQVAGDVIRRTNVRIDPRFGAWDPTQFTVTKPPAAADPTMPSTTVAGLSLQPSASGAAGSGAVGSPTTP